MRFSRGRKVAEKPWIITHLMKRIHDIFEETVSCKALVRAHEDVKRKKRKKNSRKIAAFEADFDRNIQALHESLMNGTWRMHPYRKMFRYESGKLREIDYSPDWSDQIVQRAIGNTLGAALNRTLINDTYAGIPGRGIKRAMRRMRRRVYDIPKDEPLYAYKCDMKKFYPSINHQILKEMLIAKIKDRRMLDLLFVIIDSYPGGVGLPIGNLMSPVFANFYLSGVDRLAKNLNLIYYRYNDDIAVISTSKSALRNFKDELHLLAEALCLRVKASEQIFPITRFGVDIMGYVMKRSTVMVRRRIERRFRRNALLFSRKHEPHGARSLSSQWGWLKITKTGIGLWKKAVGCDFETFKKSNLKTKHKNAGANKHD